MAIFDIFKRKKEEPVKEERSEPLGGLLFSQAGFTTSAAMKLAAFYCGVNQLSNAVGTLPLRVMRIENGRKIMVPDHKLLQLLNLSPDELFNHFNFYKSIVESVIIQGNGYGLIERDSRLNVKKIHLLNPEYVSPLMATDGTMKYMVAGLDSAVDSSDMLHFAQRFDEQHNGISVLKYAYKSLKTINAAEETAGKFFGSNAGLNAVLKANAPVSTEQKKQIRQSWGEAFNSAGNGIAILPMNLDYQPVSVNPKDAELLNSREFGITEIARWLNISPLKLFQMEDMSYNSLEATQLYFLQDSITPYTTMIEEELNRKLFKPSEVGQYSIEFDFEEALKTNRKEMSDYYRTCITNGLMTINEARERMGMSPSEINGADDLFIQLSYQTVNNIAEGKFLKEQETQTQDPNSSKNLKE